MSTIADVEKGRASHHHNGTNGTNSSSNADPILDQAPPPFQRRGTPTRLGNPGPLGLCSFASTTLVLSLINLQTKGVKTPNVVVGMAAFVGGLTQLLAGMWEFAVGNTFGATAFAGYGSFWMSFATIFWPSSGILAAYAETPRELDNALALYLTTWFIFTFLMFIASLRRNAALIALFGFLTITFMLLAIADFYGNVTITKAGGAFGVITAFIAYYTALGEILRPDDSWFTLPLGHIPKRLD